VLLYHLVTGSYPVRGNSLSEIVDAHKRGERHQLHKERPDLPDAFVRVIEKATAVDPADRIATAGALENALTNGRSQEKPRPIAQPLMMLTAVLGAIVAVIIAVWIIRPENPTKPSAAVPSTLPPSATSPGAPASPGTDYTVDATFYRVGPNGDEKLSTGSRVKPGDELFLKFQASVPVNLYVVNEDELGNSFLEFPLADGQGLIQPSHEVTLPERAHWQIDKAGVHEHFLVFASPERMDAFAQVFASLPSPKENQPVVTERQLDPEQTMARLRSVGGLVPTPSKETTATAKGLSQLFTTPLTNARESVRGPWVRQITFDNPER
jgi:hypothetical protein